MDAQGILRASIALALLFGSACAAQQGSDDRFGGAGTAGADGLLAGSAGSSGAAGSTTEPFAGTAGTVACAPDSPTCMPTAGTSAGSTANAGASSAGASGASAGGGASGTGNSVGLDPNEPTCFEFRNHGQPVAGDTSKYPIPPGEQYVCYNYDVPWNEPVEMVSYETLYDNEQVIHHWLLYSVPLGAPDQTFLPCIGTHVLQDAQLVGGWAVGSNDVEMPPDVGLRMPNKDRAFQLEWHFFNSTSEIQEDGSGIRICVLPAGSRTHTAGMTWLGTEDFNGPAGMPSGVVSNFGGTCPNDSAAPITIFRLWPHMHQWGRHMQSEVIRAGTGAIEPVFAKDFDFNYQISYEINITLMPGDSIRSTCRFENMSGLNVAFGPSSEQEMCYQFAFSYPAGALDNGVLSLVGATNTCW